MYDRVSALAAFMLACLACQALADVDLVTIPRREGTQLTIYNSEDITMVREHRLLTVKPGINRIQFSWANTLIDPTSIDFRILDHQDRVDLIDTTFPAGRNDALQWNIRSQMAGRIPVEIRYFTSGITWKADYVGIANGDETKLRLTGYVRVFKNKMLLDEQGDEIDLPAMENLGLSPLPDGMVRLYSEYANKDLAYVGGTATKYVPIGDRVEVNVGRDPDITILRRQKDRQIANVVARQYKRRIDNTFVMYYDLIDYDETFFYEEEIVSGKPVVAKTEIERRFDANVVLWGSEGKPKDWNRNEEGAYVDLHLIDGRVERVDQNHVKYFLDLNPGEKRFVKSSVTYKRRKVGPELNQEKKREPI